MTGVIDEMLVMEATSRCGMVVHTVIPDGRAAAHEIIENDLAPYGWTGRILRVLPLEQAVRHFHRPASVPELVEEADLFEQTKQAVVGDPRYEGADDPRVEAILAHLHPHRPMRFYTGRGVCLDGECDHDRVDDQCSQMLLGRICRACSVMCDTGLEDGPQWPVKVPWPCTPLETVTSRYGIRLSQFAADGAGR